MILSGHEIERQVRLGTITIEPFTASHINPNSYNYRLGPLIRELSGDCDQHETPSAEIPSDGLVLRPRRVYLGHTMEVIGSAHYVTSLIGRSSVGRLGLYLQLSADLGNLGSAHCWTLELAVVQPLRVYAGMKIGQVSFWRPYGDISTYRGEYTEYSIPRDCLDSELKAMKA